MLSVMESGKLPTGTAPEGSGVLPSGRGWPACGACRYSASSSLSHLEFSVPESVGCVNYCSCFLFYLRGAGSGDTVTPGHVNVFSRVVPAIGRYRMEQWQAGLGVCSQLRDKVRIEF